MSDKLEALKEKLCKGLIGTGDAVDEAFALGLHSKWNSVEDMLPEEGDNYLVFNGIVQIAYFDEDDKSWEDNNGYLFGVTHWQPLLQPPIDNVK